MKITIVLKEYFLFLFFSSLVICFYQFFFITIPDPFTDALDTIRYIQYGLNLKDHGIFGLYDESKNVVPGNENTPLFPFLIYIASSVNEDLYRSLTCLIENRSSSSCNLTLDFFVWTQCLFILITISCIWLLAKLLTKSTSISWLAAYTALLSGELHYFANRFLTESLVICLFSAFVLALYLSFKGRNLYIHTATAILLSLLTLTRPEYYYVSIVLFISLLLFCLNKKKIHYWNSLFTVFIVYFLIVGTWQIRNYHHFDTPSLTGNYGGIVLAHRVAYNQMTWPEWAVSFVYWFPDCGDSISEKIFPEDYYNKLGFDSNSYHRAVKRQLVKKMNLEINSPEEALGYLLKNEIIDNFFKHSMVTLPLIWRGIFIGKYWGVAGLLSFMILAFRHRQTIGKKLLALSLPAWFLVFLHAFVSVNIPRYNLILIPFYSISIAFIIVTIIQHIGSHVKHGKKIIK